MQVQSDRKLPILGDRKHEQGVTALIIVIFSALLLSVITISFIAVMVKEQGQSGDNEISQSAYDSAMAGVEDAKRAIIACRNGNTAACTAIAAKQCNTIAAAGITGSPTDSETLIQSSSSPDSSDAALNQAYTCVKVAMNTPDYVLTAAEMAEGKSQVVPLRGVDEFSKVQIEWQLDSDSNGAVFPLSNLNRCNASTVAAGILCEKVRWGSYPALIRLQAITPTPKPELRLSDLDKSSFTGTAFLYPTALLASSSLDVSNNGRFTEDGSAALTNTAKPVSCIDRPDYKCVAMVELPRTIDERGDSISLLRLTTLYRSTSVKISLYNSSGGQVDFDGVQPTVDSTGRAGDIFRRVSARLALTDQLSYPEYAVDLDGSLCKNFYVTGDATQVNAIGGSSCNP